MVDIDRGPSPRDLLAALIAGGYWRAERVDALTDATQGIDAAITANYLVDPQLTREARVVRYAEAVRNPGAFVERRRVSDVYPNSGRTAWETLPEWQTRAVMVLADAELDELADLIRKFGELAALGWAVKKAKGRGEVEVLIANLEADAHRTQHEETTC